MKNNKKNYYLFAKGEVDCCRLVVFRANKQRYYIGISIEKRYRITVELFGNTKENLMKNFKISKLSLKKNPIFYTL